MTLDNYPTVRPAQSLDFAKSRYLPPEVTFSRATPATNGSDGTYVGPTGIKMSDENTPRFTWENGKCRGLLIEPSRTNILPESGNLNDQTYWHTSTNPGSLNQQASQGWFVATANTTEIVSPDGTNNACKLSGNTASTYDKNWKVHVVPNASTVSMSANVVYTWTLFVNDPDSVFNGDNVLEFMYGNRYSNTNARVIFDLSNDTVTYMGDIASESASITPYPNGWKKLTATWTNTSSGGGPRYYLEEVSPRDPSVITRFSANGEKFYVWGFQIEEGSFPTSYIPTSGSTATRGADSAEFTSATTSGTVINHPFGASDGRKLIALGEGAGPVPVERVDVYSQHLDQTQIRTLAGLPITNEFWYWRVYGSEFGFETAVTDAFTDGQITVDWGDGTPQEVLAKGMHTFAKGEGFYEVGFRLDSGTFFYPRYIEADNDSVQRKKIIAVGPAPASMIIKPKRNFENAKELEAFDATVAFLDSTTSMEDSFNNCDKLLGLPYFDSSNITTFASVCNNCAVLREFPLIDTSSGTLFGSAWRDCVSLKSFPLLDMSSATSVEFAWRNTALTGFPGINLPEVTNAKGAWRACSDLVDFAKINMDKCKDFEDAWQDCTSLVTFPANFFNSWTASPNNYCFFGAWAGCTALSATSVERILDSLAVADQNAPTGSGDQITITIDYDDQNGASVPYGGTLNAGVITPTPASITTLKGKTRPWIIKINNVVQ